MISHYEVEMLFYPDGWENCWKDDNDAPLEFNTFDEALAELNCHLTDLEEARLEGYLQDTDNAHDYRIVKVSREVVHQYSDASSAA